MPKLQVYMARIIVDSGTPYVPPTTIEIEFLNGGDEAAAVARGLIMAEARKGELVSCDKVKE